MSRREIPLLQHPLSEPSAFTAEALVSAVRSERKLPVQPVPRVCVLEFDGDLTDWLITAGYATPCERWACFHTAMHTIDVGGNACGIIARAIGGPFAVLVAEQLKAPGAELIFGLTSAGRVSPSLPLPSLLVVQEAIRDEGTSYHYIGPGDAVESDPDLVMTVADGIRSLGLPVSCGLVWTTDAPYRETQQQLDKHAADGVLAVEMQAASLLAFSKAAGMRAGIIALVSNAVDQTEKTFDKGPHEFGRRLIETMCLAGIRYLEKRNVRSERQ